MEIYERIGETEGQIESLNQLAWLFFGDKQLDAAEEAATRAIDLVSGKGQEFYACQLHRTLGQICGSKGDKKNAIHHFETALGIASSFNWCDLLFWIHYGLAYLFLEEDGFYDASTHIERAKTNAVNDAYHLGRARDLQARVWHRQRRLEDAKSEASQALEIFESLGAAGDQRDCGDFLDIVEQEMTSRSNSLRGELLKRKESYIP